MKKLIFTLIIVFSSLIVGGTFVEARTMLTEAALKEKITNNKISTLYLLDGAIGGLEVNQYGLVSEEVVILGPYKKIPDDIITLARQHNVNIKNEEDYGSEGDIFSYLIIRAIPSFLTIFSLLGIFIVLILINKKLASMLKIWNKNQ